MRDNGRYQGCPIWILATLFVMLLAACSKEDGTGREERTALRMVSMMRSSTFTAATDYSPLKLYLYSVEDGTMEGLFSYFSGETIWKSSLEVTASRSYAIFGFAPVSAGTVTLTGVSLNGATMNISNVNAVSADDICVVVGVQQLETKETDKDIKQGVFSFTGQGQDENYVNLLMDHLYAAVRFQIAIDADYALLRSIKIKKMELQSDKGTSNITVPLTANDTNSSPIGTVNYTTSGTGSSAVFFDSEAGVALSDTQLTEATCCFVPLVGNGLTLKTTYEVYDRNHYLIGERQAINKLPDLDARRGQRVTFYMTVAPTYLYQLSEPDLDNPTFTVN